MWRLTASPFYTVRGIIVVAFCIVWRLSNLSFCSGPAAWQALIAYDACVRLCLRAWAKGCMEAPEFLLNECLVLRNAFG